MVRLKYKYIKIWPLPPKEAFLIMKKIEVYDTTLRDGAQREGISFSLTDKLKIAKILDELGVDFIEGGWPGSNPKDAAFFREIKRRGLKMAKIAAFGMTAKKGTRPEYDLNLRHLLESRAEVLTIFGKSWDLHVKKILKANLKENLSLIKKSCAFLASRGKIVFYDAEHFFDGFKANPGYALATLKAAVEGGAKEIILCDTNGGTLPWEIAKIIKKVKKEIETPLGIHSHNDNGLALANALAAVKEGAVQIQGTINGYGERCGNLNLCSAIPNLQIKMGYTCLPQKNLSQLTETSRYIAEIANQSPDPFQPFVGRSAFSHKGGVHVDGMLKCDKSYQHVDPSVLGNSTRVVVSELSGKANIVAKAKYFGLNLSQRPNLVKTILKRIKSLEKRGLQFEGADASLELLVRRVLKYKPHFNLSEYFVSLKKRRLRLSAKADVELKIGNKKYRAQGEGRGPVNALDKATRKVLLPFYPELKNLKLTDYKVRIVDGKRGTAARVRVLIECSYGKRKWETVGCSTNIIEASWQALADSLEYAFLHPLS